MLGPTSRLRPFAVLSLCARHSVIAGVLAFAMASPSIAHAQTTGGNSPEPAASPASPQGPTGSSVPVTPNPTTTAPTPAPGRGAFGAGARTTLVAPASPTAPARLPSVDTNADARDLAKQGSDRPDSEHAADVFSEDWWGRTRPVLELHGYFRTRGELFHNFALGRHDTSADALWPQPIDNTYVDKSGIEHAVKLCGSDLGNLSNCQDKSQATANMRLRLNPEIHISDNLRIQSQIDALDNLVLGSTPNTGTPNTPTPFFSATQNPPASAVTFKRAWAEYVTPVGQLRFGRMPDHWGLGMVHNGGDYLDADYQSTVDRIQFVTGLRALDLYFGASWDFVGSGPVTYGEPYGTEPYNQGNLVNVDQWSAFIAKRMNPDLQRLALARNDVVFNTGVYATYRKQLIDLPVGQANPDLAAANNGLERRGAYALTPDLWLQILWNKLRFEAEGAMVYGSIERLGTISNTEIRQYGVTTQTEFKAVEDKLRLQFGFGWASGDPWVEGLTPPATGIQPRFGNGPISTFAFNPAYQVDLIFFRHILSRVEGAYYFRPSVEYDFLKNPNGQRFGGNAAIIWSRASEYMQTPGNRRDLGVELNISLYYQAKDGSLNDNPDRVGGFYSMLQYGVFFPMGGLDYLPGQKTTLLDNWDTSSAQTVRLFLGVAF